MDGPRIEMEPNGPYVVYGPAIIVDADGHERHVEAGHSVKLCRWRGLHFHHNMP